jgi:NADH dehydrogenase/NADH:ubiquinone oxidoreductase subunit G
MTMECGPGRQVFTEERIQRDKARRIGASIVLDQERCIVCFRCTRFLSEWASEQVFEFTDRGDRNEIEPAFGEPIAKARFAGNTIDLCPVGALTSDFFRFSARPWELADAPGVCPHCPVGCNLVLGGRLGTLCRVQPRTNYYVNDTWICDRGRYDYDWVNDGRLTRPAVLRDDQQRASDWDAALTRAASTLRDAGSFAVVLSPSTSCEAGWLASRLAALPNCGGLYVEDDFDPAGPFAGTMMDLMYSDVVLLVSADVLENQPIIWLRMNRRAREGRLRMITASHPVVARDQKLLSWSGADLPKSAEAALLAALADLIPSGEAQAPDGISPEWLQATAAALRDAKRPAVVVGAVPVEAYAGVHEALDRLTSALQEGRRSRVAHGILTGGANSRGLRAVGCESRDAWTAPRGWRHRLKAGEFAALLIVGGDPLARCEAALAQAARDLRGLIYVGTNESETSGLAAVVLPAASFQEEEFTFVNFEGRLQRSVPTNEPIWDTLPTHEILACVCELLGSPAVGRSAARIRAAMAEASESLRPWADPIPPEGIIVPG